jgi:hypothetical protein
LGATDKVRKITADVVAIGNEPRHRLLLAHELIGEAAFLVSSQLTDGVGILKIEVTTSTLEDLHAQPLLSNVHRATRRIEKPQTLNYERCIRTARLPPAQTTLSSYLIAVARLNQDIQRLLGLVVHVILALMHPGCRYCRVAPALGNQHLQIFIKMTLRTP